VSILFPNLFHLHPIVLAIYKQAVIDSHEDIGRLVEKVEKKYPLDKVSIEYVSKEKLQLIL